MAIRFEGHTSTCVNHIKISIWIFVFFQYFAAALFIYLKLLQWPNRMVIILVHAAHLWFWRKKRWREKESQATDREPAHLLYIIHGTPSINGSGTHAVQNRTPLARTFWMQTEQIDWFLARERLPVERVPKSVCLPCFLVATRANWGHYYVYVLILLHNRCANSQ